MLTDECGLGLLLLAALDCSCLLMAAPEAGGTGGIGVTSRAEGSMAQAQPLKAGYWDVKLALLPEVLLENPGPGVS